MVTYAEFTAWSTCTITSTDFTQVERTSVDILSTLCNANWDETDEVCKKAVMYQIEHIIQIGGLGSWAQGKGSVGSHTYSIGGESESVSYIQTSKESERGKTFNGLSISPFAWALLKNNGSLKTVSGVRIW